MYSTYLGVNSNLGDNPATPTIDESQCKDKYTISQADGTITITVDNTALPTNATAEDCAYAETDTDGDGQKLDQYTKVLPYRFYNGKLQLDGNNNDFVADSDLVEFCIDQNQDNTCD